MLQGSIPGTNSYVANYTPSSAGYDREVSPRPSRQRPYCSSRIVRRGINTGTTTVEAQTACSTTWVRANGAIASACTKKATKWGACKLFRLAKAVPCTAISGTRQRTP